MQMKKPNKAAQEKCLPARPILMIFCGVNFNPMIDMRPPW